MGWKSFCVIGGGGGLDLNLELGEGTLPISICVVNQFKIWFCIFNKSFNKTQKL